MLSKDERDCLKRFWSFLLSFDHLLNLLSFVEYLSLFFSLSLSLCFNRKLCCQWGSSYHDKNCLLSGPLDHLAIQRTQYRKFDHAWSHKGQLPRSFNAKNPTNLILKSRKITLWANNRCSSE